MLDQAAAGDRPRLRDAIRTSGTGAAAGLAGATLVNNAIQLVFTIAITRLLGADDYGALAAIIGAFLILVVGGQSIQAAAARETAKSRGATGRLRVVVGSDAHSSIINTLRLLEMDALVVETPNHRLTADAVRDAVSEDAEGIAAESLLIDPRTRAALPDAVGGTRHGFRTHLGYEVQENLLSVPDAVDLLRRASSAH